MEEIELRDLVRIVWKRKWIIIILPVILAIIAFIVSKDMTPTYTSSAQISLGKFNNGMYNEPQAVQQLITNRDMLNPIIKKLQLDVNDIGTFQKSIKVKPNDKANMIQIETSYSNPVAAQKIAEELLNSFIQKSDEAYQQKKEPLDQLLNNLQKQLDLIGKSLNRNKEVLTGLETNGIPNNTEEEITRTRLLNYVLNDENTMNSLSEKLKDISLKESDLQKASVFEQPNLPTVPTTPRPLLNAGIAIVVGFMISLFLVFIIEYFANNPIRLREKTELM